ncbi:MexH family multidrug efflux RND transporter periplasmic adaptor subunit [Thiohalobacter sp. COW1]|nr:MexH family multidrug efflux RND transporter periplasmic adaptor subunit [Thiohalobacter sp. COW1]
MGFPSNPAASDTVKPRPVIRSRFPYKSLSLLALVAIAVALVLTRPAPPPAAGEPPPLRVRVATVAQEDVTPLERVSGRLQAARQSRLRFEVGGQVERRRVEPGMQVGAGQPLLELDAADLRAAVTEARAGFSQEQTQIERDRRLLVLARDNVALQRDEVRRLESLSARELGSASQLDAARGQLLQLEAELARLQAGVDTAEARLALRRTALERAERDLARSVLKAPFAGVVNAVALETGDYVTPGGEAVTLVDPTALDFYAELRGEVARALAPGQAVTVEVDGRMLEGRILALQAEPDETTFTHAVRVRLDGAQASPGELAMAAFPLRRREAARLIPVTAVLRDEGRSYVFRVTDGRLERLPVELGLRLDSRYIVRTGPAAGQVIVARDVAALSDGQPVEIVGD